MPDPYDWTNEPPEGAWLGLALLCGLSGAIVGALIVGVVWWLS